MLFKYSNGWGHLIMSLFFGLIGLALIVWPGLNSATQGVGIGLLLTVSGAWFVPGAAKAAIAANATKPLPPTPSEGGNTNAATNAN